MGDSFFVRPSESRKRSRPSARSLPNAKTQSRPSARDNARNDEDITSESEEDNDASPVSEESESESDHETEIDKRRRLAKEYLNSLETDLVEGFDAKDLDEDIISRRLRHDVAEQHGHIFRDLSGALFSQVRKVRTGDKNLTGVVSAPHKDGVSIYTGAKNGTLSKYIVSILQPKPALVKSRHVGSGILCLAVNTANKLVVTGTAKGFRVWNAETFEMLREFKLRCPVLSLAFRRHTSELYVGASDLRLRTYDLSQFAYVETLHGHQDEILGLSALNDERCVSVGGRDRTAIFWKIPEESRLTFRGGDTRLAHKVNTIRENQLKGETTEEDLDIYKVSLEGSIDCCSMLDHQLFVTGSDNGNAVLWSTNRKKPQFVVALSHGEDPEFTRLQASADLNPDTKVEIPPRLPRAVTAIYAVPFSNVFFTGSWSGDVHMWALSEDKRSFSKVQAIETGKGIVTGVSATEIGDEYVVTATIAREPRLGRWLVRPGHDRVVAFTLSAVSHD